MNNEIFVKEIPSYIIYYCDGMIADFSKILEFVLQSGAECKEANPNLKCVSLSYCYINYLDGEYKEKDIKIRYAEAVTNFGKETDNVKFMKTDAVNAVCIYHKGKYDTLRDSYNIILKYKKKDGLYEILTKIIEHYKSNSKIKIDVDFNPSQML